MKVSSTGRTVLPRYSTAIRIGLFSGEEPVRSDFAKEWRSFHRGVHRLWSPVLFLSLRTGVPRAFFEIFLSQEVIGREHNVKRIIYRFARMVCISSGDAQCHFYPGKHEHSQRACASNPPNDDRGSLSQNDSNHVGENCANIASYINNIPLSSGPSSTWSEQS
jgi:hypothetical protein